MGLHLLLMGGNGAALRMDLSSLRGSADNDYLTSASPQDVQALLDALAHRFSGMPDGLCSRNASPSPIAPKSYRCSPTGSACPSFSIPTRRSTL